MGKNLHEEIEELESQLSTTTEGDDDGRDDKPVKTARSERGGTEDDEAEDVGQEPARKRGRDGERGERGRGGRRAAGAPRKDAQGDGETSPDDAEASRGDGRGTREDGRASRSATRRTDGRGKGDELLKDGEEAEVEEAADDDANSPAALARMRRENRELKAKLREKEAAPLAAPAADTTKKPEVKSADPKVTDPEPDKAKEPEKWKDWKIRDQERRLEAIEGRTEEDVKIRETNERIRGAVDEFRQVRDRYIEKNPDYIPAFTHAFDRYAQALQLTNPTWTKEQIVKHADWQLLLFAGDCSKRGIDPAEAIYDLCIERFGYVPNTGKKAAAKADDDEGEETEEDERRRLSGVRRPEGKRPDLRVVNNNRRRSASALQGGGRGGSSQLTKEAVAGMTNGELLNLSQADWDILERLEA